MARPPRDPPGGRLVETSTLVPLESAGDPDALLRAARSTRDRLLGMIAGRRLLVAVGSRMLVVVAGPRGASAAFPWRAGSPVPAGAVMLMCVADAVVDAGPA